MKMLLMVAAGVAVGLTVAVAVLVQIIVQLAPVLVVAALAALVLHLLRRRGRGRLSPTQPWAPHPVVPAQAAPAAVGLPSAESDPVEGLHLRWGPPACEDLDAAPAITPHAVGTPVRRPHAGSRPPRAVRGRRP